ncbi:MAG: hypothetical protein WC769_06005, partial [Thermodesulfovibrionales bacterium]
MKILILNRRDIANPSKGGAEIYTHEIARGLVRKYRCQVCGYSGHFTDCSGEEMIEGVRYIRKGNEVTVHFVGISPFAANTEILIAFTTV